MQGEATGVEGLGNEWHWGAWCENLKESIKKNEKIKVEKKRDDTRYQWVTSIGVCTCEPDTHAHAVSKRHTHRILS